MSLRIWEASATSNYFKLPKYYALFPDKVPGRMLLIWMPGCWQDWSGLEWLEWVAPRRGEGMGARFARSSLGSPAHFHKDFVRRWICSDLSICVRNSCTCGIIKTEGPPTMFDCPDMLSVGLKNTFQGFDTVTCVNAYVWGLIRDVLRCAAHLWCAFAGVRSIFQTPGGIRPVLLPGTLRSTSTRALVRSSKLLEQTYIGSKMILGEDPKYNY
jgi:hypothetical protein